MLTVVTELVRVTKGLVLINCAGVTRNWNYQPGPEGLMYRWWERGGRGWRPAYWHRVGIPGSGGEQWLRADVEYILAFTDCAGVIPWADNTANGTPPKYNTGGAMSYRNVDGARKNEKLGKAKKRRISRGHDKEGDTTQSDSYVPPKLANPGVLVDIKLPLHCHNIIDILTTYEQTTNNSDQVLRELLEATSSKSLSIWLARVYSRILESSILQLHMQRNGAASSQWSEVGRIASSWTEDCASQEDKGQMREVRTNREIGGSSPGRGRNEQRHEEFRGIMPLVSSEGTQNREMFYSRVREEILRPGVLFDALPEIQKIWRSIAQTIESSSFSGESTNLIMGIPVGGGRMGDSRSSLNEAPMPIKLAKWFIASHCPPGGIVLDPFSGSGTTCDAAMSLGRRAIGCDLRFSQCELGRRRCRDVQPELFQ